MSPKDIHTLVIYGTFIDAPTPYELRLRRRHVCVIDVIKGKIRKLEPWDQTKSQFSFPEDVTGQDKHDHKLPQGWQRLIMKETQAIAVGVIDCHIHAAQFNQLGTKTDIPLMEWLTKYTFPEESAFKDPAHCTQTYSKLLSRLLRNATTTAVYYASNHLSSAKILAETAAAYGQRAYVGKTCSDQLVPDYYVETTKQSVAETEEFLQWVKGKWGGNTDGRDSREALVKAVITPRFVPTCSWMLLKELGRLAKEYDAFVQTHVAESVDEVMLVAEQHPELKRDIKILEETGLLTDRTILDHCTHLSDTEVGEIVRKDAGIVCCPYSNMLFARSVVNVPRYYNPPPPPDGRFSIANAHPNLSLRKIALGTDIAGGPSPSMWVNMRLAIIQDRIPSFRNMSEYPEKDSPGVIKEPPTWLMTHTYTYHLATVGGAAIIGMSDLLGVFEVTRLFDAFLVDWAVEDGEQAFDIPAGVHRNETEEQWEERVRSGWERFVMGGDDR
ncbi:hypothetical protein BGX38DRAFT_1085974 [Terfezia claveryi]|nr:hypothetical protein BGX38DRAFT_1085974 [Terfezia claveryi]